MPIALLQFPNDLLQEVFRLCDPFDLYKLSKCSTKCSQKLIALGGTKKWKIGFCGGNETAIWVDYPIYYFKQTDNPEDYFATRCLGGCVKQMYIEFSNGGPVDLFFYLLDTFGIGIVKLLENTFGSLDKVSEVAEALIDRNMEIELPILH